MAQRVTLRKRTPYNTTSSRRRVVKTPGGKLVYHHLKKLPTAPKCGDCGIALPGVRTSVPNLHDVRCILMVLCYCVRVDPCAAPASVRNHLQDPKVGAPGIRWFTVRRVCEAEVRLPN